MLPGVIVPSNEVSALGQFNKGVICSVCLKGNRYDCPTGFSLICCKKHFKEPKAQKLVQPCSMLRGKYHRNLVLYQKLQNVFFFFLNRNLIKVLLKFVVDCHPSLLRLLTSVSGYRWTGLEWTAT